MASKDIILNIERIEHYQKYIKDRVLIQEDGCWLWNGASNERGYGKAYLNDTKQTISAHRMSYAAFNGGVLKSHNEHGKRLVVRHNCDRPRCVNPKDLLIGTDVDNRNDMVAAGTALIGEKNPKAVYTEEQVKNVIESKGKMTQRERAEMFGVSPSAIEHIDSGRSWAHHPARPIDFQPPAKRVRPERPDELSLDMIEEAYQRILKKCTTSAEPNKHTGTHCKLWTGSVTCGYGRINVGQHFYLIHHIALMYKTGDTFIPEDLVVRHLCGVRKCGNESHVVIGDHSDNTYDQIRMGIHATTVLNEVDVKEVWRLYDVGMTLTGIANQFGVSLSAIGDIIHGRSWTHVKPDQPVVKRAKQPRYQFTEDQVREIRRLYTEGLTQTELAERYGTSKYTIYDIVHYRSYRHVVDTNLNGFTTTQEEKETSPESDSEALAFQGVWSQDLSGALGGS